MANAENYELQELQGWHADAIKKGDTARANAIQVKITEHPKYIAPSQTPLPPIAGGIDAETTAPPPPSLAENARRMLDGAVGHAKQLGSGVGIGLETMGDAVAYGIDSYPQITTSSDPEHYNRPAPDFGAFSKYLKSTPAFQQLIGDDYPEPENRGQEYTRDAGIFLSGLATGNPFSGAAFAASKGALMNFARNAGAFAVAPSVAGNAVKDATGNDYLRMATEIASPAFIPRGRALAKAFTNPLLGTPEAKAQGAALANDGVDVLAGQGLDNNLVNLVQGTSRRPRPNQVAQVAGIAAENAGAPPAPRLSEAVFSDAVDSAVSKINTGTTNGGNDIIANLPSSLTGDLAKIRSTYESSGAKSGLPDSIKGYVRKLFPEGADGVISPPKTAKKGAIDEQAAFLKGFDITKGSEAVQPPREITVGNLNQWRSNLGEIVKGAKSPEQGAIANFMDTLDGIIKSNTTKKQYETLLDGRLNYKAKLMIDNIVGKGGVPDIDEIPSALKSVFGKGYHSGDMTEAGKFLKRAYEVLAKEQPKGGDPRNYMAQALFAGLYTLPTALTFSGAPQIPQLLGLFGLGLATPKIIGAAARSKTVNNFIANPTAINKTPSVGSLLQSNMESAIDRQEAE